MALLRTKEVRAMDAEAREKKLLELRDELMHERGIAAMGGAPPNPGKIRALRKNISRIHTVQTEEALAPPSSGVGPSKPSGKAATKSAGDEAEEDAA